MKKESLKNNLICWLFGHALPLPPHNFSKIPRNQRDGEIVKCERCNTFQPLVNFKAYRDIRKVFPN